MAGYTPPTEAEVAAKQEAVGRAFERWVDRWDGKLPHNPPTEQEKRDTDYAEWGMLVEASGEALADLGREVQSELRDA